MTHLSNEFGAINARTRLLLLILGAAIQTGCASGGFVGKLVGQEKPTPELALLKPIEGFIVHSIDDQKLDIIVGSAGHAHDYEIGLKEGTHRVLLSYNHIFQGPLVWYSEKPKEVSFYAHPGKKYIILPGITSRGPGPITWDPFVKDLTDDQKCWSVFLQTPFFYMKQDCRDAAASNR